MVSEEDIKILRRFIKDFKECKRYCKEFTSNVTSITREEYQALENLLQGYKELKEERELIGIPVKNKIDGKIGIVLHQWKSGSVAVLEKISPRVINTHDSWNTLEIITDTVVPQTTKDDSIPKSLVEEKLNKEVLPNIIVGGRRNGKTLEYGKKLGRIEMCEELLKGDK